MIDTSADQPQRTCGSASILQRAMLCTLVSAVVLWILAVLRLYRIDRGEPPAVLIVLGCLFQVTATIAIAPRGDKIAWGVATFAGAFAAWAISPEIGGRFADPAEDMTSFSKLGFGAVVSRTLGGIAGVWAYVIAWPNLFRTRLGGGESSHR